MAPLDFLVLALVLRVVAYCWFKSALWPLPELRATAEVYEEQDDLYGTLATAFKCPYCAVHHFGTLLAIVPLLYREAPTFWFLILAIGYGWAAGELVWLTDTHLPDHASYHRRVVSNYDGPSPAETPRDVHRDDVQPG